MGLNIGLYYNKNGEPITSEEWGTLFVDYDYKIIQKDELDKYVVSTVWLGMNHNFEPDGPPLIFETMVFPNNLLTDIECHRYATEEEAIQGHKKMVERYGGVVGNSCCKYDIDGRELT